MSSPDAAVQPRPGRRRRAHKRSRNGCFTCKQRHARCDEQRPICTNCLTKGGACGYPNAIRLQPGSSLSSTPADPFGSLPVPMPYKSHLLWHHFVHYRMFTRSPVPKNPVSIIRLPPLEGHQETHHRNTFVVEFALMDPGLFHGCIMLSAMNWTWNIKSSRATLVDIQETYLHHKVQTIELIKERLAQPEGAKHVVDVIALLALVESGMGEVDAAEAHLNAVANLLDMANTEKWELEHHGMMQRTILLAGSFIAAARGNNSDDMGRDPLPPPGAGALHYTRRPSTFFSAAPFDSTRLSPFYYKIPPDVECCNSEIENEVMINALRRLSLMPVRDNFDGITIPAESGSTGASEEFLGVPENATSPDEAGSPHSSSSSHYSPTPLNISNSFTLRHRTTQSPDNIHSQPNIPQGTMKPESFATLMRDTDAYIGSMLFRPDPPGYKSLDPAVIPDSTRAGACTNYLYLHLVLWQIHGTGIGTVDDDPAGEQISDNLLKWLVDQARDNINRTRGAMRLGAICGKLWFWKVVVTAYASSQQKRSAAEEENASDWKAWAVERVQSWSERSRARDWATAKHALRTIAWVDGSDLDRFAERLWGDAVDE